MICCVVLCCVVEEGGGGVSEPAVPKKNKNPTLRMWGIKAHAKYELRSARFGGVEGLCKFSFFHFLTLTMLKWHVATLDVDLKNEF